MKPLHLLWAAPLLASVGVAAGDTVAGASSDPVLGTIGELGATASPWAVIWAAVTYNKMQQRLSALEAHVAAIRERMKMRRESDIPETEV